MFANMSDVLLRQMWDDLYKCIYCGNKKLEGSARFAFLGFALGLSIPKEVHCDKCGKRLSYFEERTYGLSKEELRKRYNAVPSKKWPIWRIE